MYLSKVLLSSLELIFNVLLNNVPDTRTHDILTPWAPVGAKNEKFQCPSEREGPEDFKNQPTFVPSAILGGVMASQTWEHFFWDTL